MECACSKLMHVEQSFHDDEFPSFVRREAENLRDAVWREFCAACSAKVEVAR
jgi:hypothetical protein